MCLFEFLRLSRQKLQILSNFKQIPTALFLNGTRKAMTFQNILAFIGIILLVRYSSHSTFKYTRLVINLPTRRNVLKQNFNIIIWSNILYLIECNYPSNFFNRPLQLLTISEITNKVLMSLLRDARWLFFNILYFIFF